MKEEKAQPQSDKAADLINDFLSRISHEIRTPVNGLQQAAKQLEHDLSFFNNRDISRLTNIMVEDSERLGRTIDLLVNVSLVKTGNYKPKFEKFDLFHEVLAKLVSDYKPKAEFRGLRFIINSTTLNCEIKADRYSVTQIFSNIIDNAINYTEKGVIEIDIHRNSDLSLSISVIDTGIGMESSFLEEIYIPFSQESNGYSRTYDGMGLGIPLVKGFCDLNNIELTINSQKDAGTVVSLRFQP